MFAKFFVLFSVVILVTLAQEGQDQPCTSTAVKLDTSIKPLRFATMTWRSSLIANKVAAILVEETLGIPVEVSVCTRCYANGTKDWLLMEKLLLDGTYDAAIEMWPNPIARDTDIISPLPLGVIGQIGWYFYVPANNTCEGGSCIVTGWRDLRESSIVSQFGDHFTNITIPEGYGAFHTVRGRQSSIDAQIIRNLDLKLVLVEHPTDKHLSDFVTVMCYAHIPILHYLFQPNGFFFRCPTSKRIALPDYSANCFKGYEQGTINCDFPPESLFKGLSPNFLLTRPDAYTLLYQFLLTTSTYYTFMQHANMPYNYSIYNISCNWVNTSAAIWQPWVNNALPLAPNKPTVIINTNDDPMEIYRVAASYVGFFLGLLIIGGVAGFFIMRRLRRRAAATVKKSFHINEADVTYDKLIGRGNFGKVFKGEYRGTEVAVKRLIYQKMSNRDMSAFSAEVSALVNLRHPNILLFMGACADPPNLSIITEYMRYGNLYDLLRSDGVDFNFDYKTVISLAYNIAKGMQFIHAAGMLHRDLKTPNLLMNDNHSVKIADFGLSCLNKADATVHTSLIWTAPEVLQGNKHTAKSDVYSFGIILWELLARNELPFPLLNTNAISKAVINGTRPNVHDDWPAPYVAIMRQCWNAQPARRPTFAQICAQLEQLDLPDVFDESESVSDGSSSGGLPDANATSSTPVMSPTPSKLLSSYAITSGPLTKACTWQYMAPNESTSFVMTNIPDATEVWEWNASVMANTLTIVNKEIRHTAQKYKGYQCASNGNSLLFAFCTPILALSFCFDTQQALKHVVWPAELALRTLPEESGNKPKPEPALLSHCDSDPKALCRLGVGLGVHSGIPLVSFSQPKPVYYGSTVDCAIYVGAIATSGQILISQSIFDELLKKENKITENHKIAKLTMKSHVGTLYEITPTDYAIQGSNNDCGKTNVELQTIYEKFNGKPLASDRVVGATTFTSPESPRGAGVNEEPNMPELMEPWMLNMTHFVDTQKCYNTDLFSVYQSVYTSNNRARFVAVQKYTFQKISEQGLLYMRVEAQKLCTLSHPNVCPLVGLVMSPLSLVWDWCAEDYLFNFIESDKKLPFDMKIRFLIDIANGMMYLQEEKVYFELSPAAVLITENGLKITDYGFASLKTVNQTLTSAIQVGWTAPEIFTGGDVTEKANVYSFGVIMWQMLTRKKPWEGKHPMKVIGLLCDNDERLQVSPRLTVEGSPSPNKLDKYKKLMANCWHKNPHARLSFAEILDLLEQLV